MSLNEISPILAMLGIILTAFGLGFEIAIKSVEKKIEKRVKKETIETVDDFS